jgi:hypothetical protein
MDSLEFIGVAIAQRICDGANEIVKEIMCRHLADDRSWRKAYFKISWVASGFHKIQKMAIFHAPLGASGETARMLPTLATALLDGLKAYGGMRAIRRKDGRPPSVAGKASTTLGRSPCARCFRTGANRA